jgi:hypothetical protein
MFSYVYSLGRDRARASLQPLVAHCVTYDPILYHSGMRMVVFVPMVRQMTHHLALDHYLVEQEPMFILARGRMGHTTFPLTVRG